jgi:hypothetical protein
MAGFFAAVRTLFRLLGEVVGDWAIVAEFWIFAGPGVLVYSTGRLLKRRRAAQSLPPRPR